MLSIVQVGAGGTGSWFARTLGQIICQYHAQYGDGILLDPVRWTIADYDTIEKRNLQRQPFLGGIGVNKAKFLVGQLQPLFDINEVRATLRKADEMVRGAVVDQLVRTSLSHDNDDPTLVQLVVSCVDNTYSRQLMEEYLAAAKPKRTWYLNMGVSSDGDWFVERVSADILVPTQYDSLTYPDAMLSCGQRAETGPMPQTVYSNIMAGSMAAHSVAMLAADILGGKEPKKFVGVTGKDFQAQAITEEQYLLCHAADLAASALQEGENVQNQSADTGIGLDELAWGQSGDGEGNNEEAGMLPN